MRVTQIFTVVAITLVSTLSFAYTDAEQVIRKTLETIQPDVPVDSISASPMAGLYEVRLKGSRVLYASADGQFIVQGYMFQLKDGKPVNLTEGIERIGVAKVINAVAVAETVVYSAIGETKSHITVFTDTTCPYCQKLHSEVPELNRMGIEVRYVAFPRQGLGSSGDKQLQAVWCSEDKKAAMDMLINGRKVEAPKCVNPVAKQLAMGQSIGVSGTPVIILADGQVIPGYQPAARLGKLALSVK